jgi:AcrR family transcriptional regulator
MEKKKTTRLAREDWLQAALMAFEEKGIQGVKADSLARYLGVTRGSFYWHFKDVAQLMQAVVRQWQNEQTLTVIERNEAEGGPPEQRLLRLLRTCAQDDGRFEVGIRHWMTQDASVADIVRDVDRQRERYLAALLSEAGCSTVRAKRLAPVAYAAWLGEYSGAVQRSQAERMASMDVLFELLIGSDEAGG